MTTSSFRIFRLSGALAAVVWIGLVAARASAGEFTQTSVSDGVYTAAQADRGETLFTSTCVSCHNPKDFVGGDFLAKWEGKSLFDLFDTVKATMPMDSPGTLKPQEYADAVAYLLELNKFPAGSTELKGEEEAAMKGVTIGKKGR